MCGDKFDLNVCGIDFLYDFVCNLLSFNNGMIFYFKVLSYLFIF